MGRRRKKERKQEPRSQEKKRKQRERLPEVERWLARHQRALNISILILLLLIPLALAFTFRAYPSTLPITRQWAENSVEQQIKQNLQRDVERQFPNLQDRDKKREVEQLYEAFIANENNRRQIASNVDKLEREWRSRLQDDTGQTYLLAIDPYQFLRYMENIVEHGHPGEVLRDGEPYDTKMLAPLGKPAAWYFHTWFMAKIHALRLFFNKDATPMSTFFWLPVIFSLLAVIPAFFIGLKKGGSLGAFVAAMLVAVHAGFIGRTSAGFSDTDSFIVLFPLLTAWFFLEAFETPVYNWKRRGIFLLLAGATFGLFSFTWGNWWFFFDLYLIMLFAYIGYAFVRSLVKQQSVARFFMTDEFRWWLVMLIGFIILTGVFVIPVKGFSAFAHAPLYPLGTTENIKAAVNKATVWPNVLTTVAELNEPSISQIVKSIGGRFLFFLALMGMLFSLVSQKRLNKYDWGLLSLGFLVFNYLVSSFGARFSIMKFLFVMALPVGIGMLLLLRDERDIDVRYALFLIVWISASVFTMTKGVRFVLLLLPPFAIAAGIGAGTVFRLVQEWVFSKDEWLQSLLIPVLALLALLFFFATKFGFVSALLFILGISLGLWALWRYVFSDKEFRRYAVLPLLFLLLSLPLVMSFSPIIPAPKDDSRFYASLFAFQQAGHKAPVEQGREMGLNEVPSMTDAWWKSLRKIRDSSQPDAIINSWWDFGHWFKYVADRAVTFDGASQNTPMAHWIGRVLLTDDEREALGILRMLDCGSRLGVDTLSGFLDDDLYRAVMLTKEIILLDPAAARQRLLDEGLTESEADTVLPLTHCTPPEDYFITSGDMVGKATVWGHFGGWDFRKADAYSRFRSLPSEQAIPAMTQRYGITEETAREWYRTMTTQSQKAINTWVSPWPGYPSNWRSCQREGDILSCRLNIRMSSQGARTTVMQGLVANLSAPNESFLVAGVFENNQLVGQAELSPAAFYFIGENASTRVDPTRPDTIPSSFVVDVPNNRVLITDQANAMSMFTRLFFMGGWGTTAFELFSDERTFTGIRILVWKVDWSKLGELGLA
ncbi:hypothetical protein D6789_00550 [Candidatus Woesearchaeota archaeon]|nr:MAG: hypothetical protein D6789_00550 [Candidatus Woesearchaeota archaeon]